MIASGKKIQYIAEYIANYEAKIKALNKLGLYDNAVLFELFALELSKLWFGTVFKNLNEEKAQFPIFDLISDDGRTFVQVSTEQNIGSKIKKTLEKIKESKKKDIISYQSLSEVYFFMLSNASENNVKAFKGSSRIGDIDFDPNVHLITTNKIVNKAKADIVFQTALYELLSSEEESLHNIEYQLNKQIERSKRHIQDISSLINDEYEIDRSEIAARVKSWNNQFLMVTGAAGVGKSAFCRRLVEDENNVLFARAEKVAGADDIDNIWHLDLSRAIRYMGSNRLVLFIDSLEFIADAPKSQLDMLDDLLYTVKSSVNAMIIFSCRTSDLAAFHKIEMKYGIVREEIRELSFSELQEIAKRYPAINQMMGKPSYASLVSNPLYVDMIIKHLKSADDINDINELRREIWERVVCLGDSSLPDGISSTDIKKAIEDIALTRAKNFIIGVEKEDIPDEIRRQLLSKGIITEFEDKVRLKHDIFEDIFFERHIDKFFNTAKGDYASFFSEIEKTGKCIYRRYQIWVENKLLAASNRDRFLCALLKSGNIQEEWRNNTIIGIVNSDYCADFFKDYQGYILYEELETFIHAINFNSFYSFMYPVKYSNYYSWLQPIGEGRRSMIKLINSSEIYKKSDSREAIAGLCIDYAKSASYDSETAEAACLILEYCSDRIINGMKETVLSRAHLAALKNYLNALYLMTEYSKPWIQSFWDLIISGYRLNRRNLAEREMIEYTIKNPTASLAKNMGQELLKIAEVWWLDTDNKDSVLDEYYSAFSEHSKTIGLSRNAGNYTFDFREPGDNMFYHILLRNNFWAALRWAILLTNHVAEFVFREESNENASVEIVYAKKERKYVGNARMWAIATEDPQIHELVDDAVFLLRDKITDIIHADSIPLETRREFANNIKQAILQGSNNAMMLSVISHVGIECRTELPDYALELLSSPIIIDWDSSRKAFITPDSLKDRYRQEILNAFGMPFLKPRYNVKETDHLSLSDYAVELQLYGDDKQRGRVQNIIDDLYAKYPDCSELAFENMTIQKIDIRKAQIEQIGKDAIAVIPQITGSALEIIDNYQKSQEAVQAANANSIVNKARQLFEDKASDADDLVRIIEAVRELYENALVPQGYDNLLISMIAAALANRDISTEQRSLICNIWIDGIDKLFTYGSFLFNKELLTVLFDQLDKDLDETTLLRLRRLIVRLMLLHETTGSVAEVKKRLIEYLRGHNKTADNVCSVLCRMSREEPQDLDLMSDEILRKLFTTAEAGEKEEYLSFNTDGASDELIAAVLNCGIDLSDEYFKKIVKSILIYILNEQKQNIRTERYMWQIVNAMTSFGKQMLNKSETAFELLELLFEDISAELFSIDGFRMYTDILDSISVMFLDAYNEPEKRKLCKELIYKIENYVMSFSNERVKQELSLSLILPMQTDPLIDWNECPTSFSYEDKIFLGEMWAKYGRYHIRELLATMYSMHICELLPELILPLNSVLTELSKDASDFRLAIVNDWNAIYIINKILSTALVSYSDQIKDNHQMSEAFEQMLRLLVDFNYREAAVILNDFRTH